MPQPKTIKKINLELFKTLASINQLVPHPTLLENSTDDTIATYVTKFTTIFLYLTKLYLI